MHPCYRTRTPLFLFLAVLATFLLAQPLSYLTGSRISRLSPNVHGVTSWGSLDAAIGTLKKSLDRVVMASGPSHLSGWPSSESFMRALRCD